MSGRSPKRSRPSGNLRLIPGTPGVILRGPREPGVFSYSDDEWTVVAAANSWNPDANLHQLRIDIEAAGQRYQASRRDPQLQKRLQRALNQAVALARTAQIPPAKLAALTDAAAVIKAEIGGGRAVLIGDVLQAWKRATGDTALGFSRMLKKPWTPNGPLIRYLYAALKPILGTDMVGVETLVKAIRSARR
jgi:hypothetical protein